PDDYLDMLSSALKKSRIDVQAIGRSDITICGSKGRLMENRLVVNGELVRQVQALARLGDFWILAVGSTPEHAHEDEIPTLRRMIEAIEPAE
ncbi:MAG: hypothetical protein AAF658_20630, partial [Myxococcota bacterium]